MRTLSLAVVISLLLLMSSCDGCANEVQSEFLSPDGNKKAVVFTRSCGATTGTSVQVSVLGRWQGLRNTVGNALIVDDDHGEARSVDGTSIVRVNWEGPDTLSVTRLAKTRVFKEGSAVDGVQILHKQSKW